MSYELTIKTNTAFANEKLNKLTIEMGEAISAVGKQAEKAKILVAKNLATISADELFKEDGFESAVDYAKKVMEMSESNAYAYIQVGREINAGRLPTADANGNDFKFSQLRTLCSVKKVDTLTEAIAEGEISADMPDADIKGVVTAINPPKKARKPIPEKKFCWEMVGEDESTIDTTKTELIAQIAKNGGEFIGEIKNGDDFYVVYITSGGYPAMFRKGYEVKNVVDAEKN